MAPRHHQDARTRPRADVIVDAALASRLHGRIEIPDERIDVIDLASTKAFVNGKRVERARNAQRQRFRTAARRLAQIRPSAISPEHQPRGKRECYNDRPADE
jgi:hypothetical protein